ncbi:MAG TPA: shikimate kinase [Tepidisphaeraceae bacterium]|nr:shikimate kinase [Tepidisphaeraceae bacterium]
MLIMLVGYRGSGKSSIGRRLACELSQNFADTDAMIVRQAGRSIAGIFIDQGEAYFRDLEAAAVAEACKLDDHVVALGGGAVLRPENRAAIKASGASVIYLKCDPAVLLRRIGADPSSAESRPPLTSAGGGIEEIQRLLTERESLYREVAARELEVTHLGVEEAALCIARLI